MVTKGCPLEDILINKLVGLKLLIRKSDQKNVLGQTIKSLEDRVHKAVRNCPFLKK